MLKIDPASRTLIPISSTTLTQAKVLERTDLQQSILHSWEAFCSELGFEELFLVGSELIPHDSCDNRIDILALKRDGTPVIFELKRHREKLQLLQALSYSAMVARWDASRFAKEIGGRAGEDADELRSLLAEEGFALGSPEVVLIAESFDPEVIITADWLGEFGVPISAFVVLVVEHSGETLISIDQKFPLVGVDDIYVRRSTRSPKGEQTTSWEEAIKDVTFPFATRAVEIFRRRSGGNPQSRDFYSIYAGSPLGRLSIAFRRNYLKVYTQEQSPQAEQTLRSRLGDVIAFTKWGSESTKNSGFTFKIESEAQFEQFLRAVGESNP